MASWYRRFVPHFLSTVAPLTHLTGKNKPFSWTDECDQAFKTIRDKLVSAPSLTCPDFTRPFVLQKDASAYGNAAVLTQQFDTGEKVISFASRTLTRQEQNFSTTEKEYLAVIWAVEKFRHYLEDTHFAIITDHASLVWLNRLKDTTGRLARWALRLQLFDYEIIHRKGKENVIPDFLSRSLPVNIYAISINNPNSVEDAWYTRMVTNVQKKHAQFSQWRFENGILYKYVEYKYPALADPEIDNWRQVVPKEKRRALITNAHDTPTSGHLGSYKTYHRLTNTYYWPRNRADVASYVA